MGKKIFNQLSLIDSPFTYIAKLTLAKNYSDMSYDWVNRKIRRKKDYLKVKSLLKGSEKFKVSKYWLLSSASHILNLEGEDVIPGETKEKFRKLKMRHLNKIGTSRKFKKLRDL